MSPADAIPDTGLIDPNDFSNRPTAPIRIRGRRDIHQDPPDPPMDQRRTSPASETQVTQQQVRTAGLADSTLQSNRHITTYQYEIPQWMNHSETDKLPQTKERPDLGKEAFRLLDPGVVPAFGEDNRAAVGKHLR